MPRVRSHTRGIGLVSNDLDVAHRPSNPLYYNHETPKTNKQTKQQSPRRNNSIYKRHEYTMEQKKAGRTRRKATGSKGLDIYPRYYDKGISRTEPEPVIVGLNCI